MEDFQIFIKPVGAACNMACSYCYYPDKQKVHDPRVMSADLLENYIKKHIEASQEQDIFFSWHGGEPTLAGLQFYKRVTAFQQKHLPANRKIINGVQTNGTLLNDQWCQFFRKENFIVGISLDGPEEFHSVNRYKKSGESSFNEVLRGLDLLRRYHLSFEILCVVSAANVNFPLEVYRYFKQLGARFITFLPLVEQQNGTVSRNSVDPRSFGKFLCAVFEEWKEADIGNIRIQIIEEALGTAFQADHTLCIFKKVCGRVPVIESDGSFYSCDHFADDDHLIGNIRDHSIPELLGKPSQVNFGKEKESTLPDYCRGCEVLEMCNGGCPKDRFIYTPDDQPGLNYLCRGYWLFFNHVKPFAELIAEIKQSFKGLTG